MSLVIESCSVEELCISLGGSEKLLSELVDKLVEWLKLQPHLPQDVSTKILEVLILNSKLSLERAKKKLDLFYTIRKHVPEFYRNRNPYERNITAVHDGIEIVMLPKLTPEKCRTNIFRTTSPDSNDYHPWEAAKYILMAIDILMTEHRNFGDIFIFDGSTISMRHVMKITPSFIKKCEIVALQAYAIRLKGIHFINVPSVAVRVVTLVKSILSPKMTARIHVHPDLESLYQFVPKSILPKDYGGDQPTTKELAASLRTKVENAQDWFLMQERILVDERLRPGPAFDVDSLFGFSGSFRKLDVD